MGLLADIAKSFADLTVQVLPWFALGTLTAGLVQTFVPAGWAAAALSGRRGLPMAIGAGALLPGCSCTTIPLAIGLRGMTGPRLGTLTAFIFVSPLLSPITVALTWSLLGWEMTMARVVAALAGTVIIGLLVNHSQQWFESGRLAPMTGADPAYDACCDAEAACGGDAITETATEPGRRLTESLLAIIRQVTPYFLLGMLIAAVLATAVPEDAVPDLLGGSSGVAAFALAAVIGIPLYVCEGEEVPLTYGLVSTGLGPGPALTFLLGSVGTCVPTILMSQGIIGRRATRFYVAFWIVFAIAAGLLFATIV